MGTQIADSIPATIDGSRPIRPSDRWVTRHTFELLMDELTEDTVFDALGYAIPIIREAFEQIAAEDRYVRFDTTARPYRLTRVYG